LKTTKKYFCRLDALPVTQPRPPQHGRKQTQNNEGNEHLEIISMMTSEQFVGLGWLFSMNESMSCSNKLMMVVHQINDMLQY